jgi:hypothetical protein
MEGQMFVTSVNKKESITGLVEYKFLPHSSEVSVLANDSHWKF